MINVSKTGNTKSFSETKVRVHRTIVCNTVLFSPDFKHKVDSFNLYITDNYVKKAIGRCIPRIDLSRVA